MRKLRPNSESFYSAGYLVRKQLCLVEGLLMKTAENLNAPGGFQVNLMTSRKSFFEWRKCYHVQFTIWGYDISQPLPPPRSLHYSTQFATLHYTTTTLYIGDDAARYRSSNIRREQTKHQHTYPTSTKRRSFFITLSQRRRTLHTPALPRAFSHVLPHAPQSYHQPMRQVLQFD